MVSKVQRKVETPAAHKNGGRPKGHPKTGGRRKGTPNRRTLELAARLEDLGCDPIEGMALLAMNEENTPELRGRMYAELASYLYPKRKAVQISASDGDGKGDCTLEELLQSYRAATMDAGPGAAQEALTKALTKAETAAALGVSEKTVERPAESGPTRSAQAGRYSSPICSST